MYRSILVVILWLPVMAQPSPPDLYGTLFIVGDVCIGDPNNSCVPGTISNLYSTALSNGVFQQLSNEPISYNYFFFTFPFAPLSSIYLRGSLTNGTVVTAAGEAPYVGSGPFYACAGSCGPIVSFSAAITIVSTAQAPPLPAPTNLKPLPAESR
jgi:hypothetical protein